MKRTNVSGILVVAALLAVASAPIAVSQSPDPALTNLLPAGAILVLESGDFAGLVEGWDRSPEKKLWLQSDNYEIFSRSRLFLRLKVAQEEFAAAAGFPPEMKFLRSAAGSGSRLALYDVGDLEFLYVTRLPSARVMQTLLWKTQTSFEPRQAAGVKYFVHTDEESKRVVAYAAPQGYLLLATREELLAGALRNLSGQDGQKLADEAWYRDSVASAGRPGSLRLVMNMEAVLATPHFRSYWIHGNQRELAAYKAVLSDLHFSPQAIREDRVLLTALGGGSYEKPDRMSPGGAVVNQMLRLVPPGAGMYRAWADPNIGQISQLIVSKLLGRYNSSSARARTISSRGSNDPMEIRIDRPPVVVRTGGFAPEGLGTLLGGNRPNGLLHIQSSRTVAGGVFVANDSVLVVSAMAAWDAGAVCRELISAVNTLWTTSSLGLTCTEQSARGQRFWGTDGITGISVAAQGKYLFLASNAEALAPVLDRAGATPPPEWGEYVAGFRHSNERAHFRRMMTLLDHPWAGRRGRGRSNRDRVPQFFSDNLGSLSDSLRRVSSVTISQRTTGSHVYQTVEYRLSP